MALIKSVRGIHPQTGAECWFADNATVVGEVVMGRNCTVWFNAVVRGDVKFDYSGRLLQRSGWGDYPLYLSEIQNHHRKLRFHCPQRHCPRLHH
jgi:hypothetical protein